MSKKSKQPSSPDTAEIAVEKKSSLNFVGKRMSNRRYRQLLARVTDPLTRGAMRRLFFNQDRNPVIQSYFKQEEKDVKRPLGAKK